MANKIAEIAIALAKKIYPTDVVKNERISRLKIASILFLLPFTVFDKLDKDVLKLCL